MGTIKKNQFIYYSLMRILILSMSIILKSCVDDADPPPAPTAHTAPDIFRHLPPSIKTNQVIFVTPSRAILEGYIYSLGPGFTFKYEYGPTINYEHSIPCTSINLKSIGTYFYAGHTLTGLSQGIYFCLVTLSEKNYYFKLIRN